MSNLCRTILLTCIALAFGTLRSNAAEEEAKTLLIFGDSLTAGHGVDFHEAYPAVLQTLFDEQGVVIKVIPSGVSGETSAGGVRRIDWVLRRPVDIFLLALGGNDGLRGIDLSDTKKNLLAIIAKVRAKNPKATIIVAGMQMPPNLGERYTSEFRTLYPLVAKEAEARLLPFLLEGVGGDPGLNQSDMIHPNVEGHERVAKHVFDFLRQSFSEDL